MYIMFDGKDEKKEEFEREKLSKELEKKRLEEIVDSKLDAFLS